MKCMIPDQKDDSAAGDLEKKETNKLIAFVIYIILLLLKLYGNQLSEWVSEWLNYIVCNMYRTIMQANWRQSLSGWVELEWPDFAFIYCTFVWSAGQKIAGRNRRLFAMQSLAEFMSWNECRKYLLCGWRFDWWLLLCNVRGYLLIELYFGFIL